MHTGFSFQRMFSVARKEALHILRDPATLFFAFFIPILQLFLLGYAIDTNVRNVRTVVLDLARTEESRRLVDKFEASGSFRVVRRLEPGEDLDGMIRAGKAKVGILIPEDYSRRIEFGVKPAEVLVIIDGSESSVASTALNVANAVVTQEALALANRRGKSDVRIEAYPRILYNPDTRSANFFVPGLMVVLCQMMSVMLSANAVVREKEQGTLEQLFMTPVRSGELIFGKLLPYLVLTFTDFCLILVLMRVVFRVPIHGHVLTLLFLVVPFIFCFLGLGLFISTRVDTREAASQAAMGTVMPSIFLSGYVFPLDSMPWFFWCVAQVIPTTWLIDASRGVILRGATLEELWPHAVVLWCMGIGIFTASMFSFRKRL